MEMSWSVKLNFVLFPVIPNTNGRREITIKSDKFHTNLNGMQEVACHTFFVTCIYLSVTKSCKKKLNSLLTIRGFFYEDPPGNSHAPYHVLELY